MEGVAMQRGRSLGWSCGHAVWEGSGVEGVGGAREGIASLYKAIIIFRGGIPGFHNLYINP